MQTPPRDDSQFDSFFWHTPSADIPIGCTVFTDGSLLDNKLPKGWLALGWAFALVDDHGDLLAAAYGVPPRWVDTIQGAELWAVQMAMLHGLFPRRLWTDCDTVCIGLAKTATWAGSSKRRYARIWFCCQGEV